MKKIPKLTDEHLEILRDPQPEEVLVFDIESNHYDLQIINVIHCIAIGCAKTKKVTLYVTPDEQRSAIDRLNKAEIVVAHHGIKFDDPATRMFFKDFAPKQLVDTLILSKLAKPSLFSHSLEMWGKITKCAKGDYAKEFKEKAGKSYKNGDEWLEYSDAMGAYCIQDVVVNLKILSSTIKYVDIVYPWSSAIMEHYVGRRVLDFQNYGIAIDLDKARDLHSLLLSKREVIEEELLNDWEGYYVREWFTPKVNRKDLGYVKGVPFEKVKFVQFNPNSNDHVVKYMQEKFNWEPYEFTDGGKPKVNDEILERLSEEIPEAGLIAKYFILTRRLSYLNSYFEHEREGRIHGVVNPVGTNTFRCTHSAPNMSQVPSGKKPYGNEFRELFSHGFGDDWVFLGCDQSGIEARLLGHYCAPLDNGALNEVILKGDIHSHNQKMAGLATRDQAKTFFYSLMYGAGDLHIGKQLGGGIGKGKRARDMFMKNMKAYTELLGRIGKYRSNKEKKRPAYMKNYVKCLDGRHICVRHEHTMLNFVLQSAGAILAKAWLVRMDELFEEHGVTNKVRILLWSHDEFQCAVRKGYEDQIGKLMVQAIEESGEQFNLNIPITGEYDTGTSWKDTH